jgi:hypothetical protein
MLVPNVSRKFSEMITLPKTPSQVSVQDMNHSYFVKHTLVISIEHKHCRSSTRSHLSIQSFDLEESMDGHRDPNGERLARTA